MRISKEHDERRTEILDTAERLFQTKGYRKCTVNDILNEIGIAKGTFYYYFASKEEVMDAIVLRYTDLIVERVSKVIEQKELSPEQKFLGVVASMNVSNDVTPEMMEEMHRTENALLHQKMLSKSIELLTPYLVQIVEEGNEKKHWNCRHPEEYMKTFLAAALTLTDDGMFEQTPETMQNTMIGLMSVMDLMLELPEGSCMKLMQPLA